tara:strand:- start:467 stop:2314 length:1848 start_codon:yes stop_codon:yes gene_type:complete
MAETTTINKAEFADQLQPYVSAALTGSQDLYDAEVSAGYQGFGQPQVAGISDDLSGAIQSQIGGFNPNTDLGGVQGGLAGLTNQLQQQAAAMTQAGTGGFDQTMMDSYMNPYQQGVTDVAIRKAREESQRQQMKGNAAATNAGAFGGNRRFLLEGMRSADLAQNVGDLQAKGSAAGFNTALQQMEQERKRQLTGGSQLSNIGKTRVEGIGKAMEASEQAAGRMRGLEQEQLNDQIREFEAQKGFKGSTLDDYIRRIGGSTPKPAGAWGSKSTASPKYSGMEKFSGYASGIGNFLGGMGKFLGFYGGGPVREGFDEEVGQPGGLTALAGPTVRFNQGDPVVYGPTVPAARSREEIQKQNRAKENSFYVLEANRKELEQLNRQKAAKIEAMRRAGESDERIQRYTEAADAQIELKQNQVRRRLAAGETNPIIAAQQKIEKTKTEKTNKEATAKKAEAQAKALLQARKDAAQKAQAEKYKAYKSKIDRDNKYAAWHGMMESISQLPLSKKKDAVAIQKISRQKDIMDAKDFEQFGSPAQRKAALDVATIGLTKSKKGKAKRDKLEKVRGLILQHYRAKLKTNLVPMTPELSAQFMDEATREVASVYNPKASVYSGAKK